MLKDWLLLIVRLAVVVLAAKPIADKFFDYPGQVAFFGRLGVPQPEIMVPLVGLIELAGTLMLLLGVAGRVGGLLLLPVMAVANLTAGVTVPSAGVLIGALVIAVFGPGRYALWRPEEALLYRWQH